MAAFAAIILSSALVHAEESTNNEPCAFVPDGIIYRYKDVPHSGSAAIISGLINMHDPFIIEGRMLTIYRSCESHWS